MAETKNNAPDAFDKDGLKEWFTLAEVAERWTNATKQTITEDDLLHFGEQALLEICFQTHQRRLLGKSTPLNDKKNILHYWFYQYCKNIDVLEGGYAFDKGYFVTERGYGYNNDLYALEIPNIKRLKSGNKINVYGGAVGQEYVEFGRTILNLEDPSKNSFLALPEEINANNLLITKDERDRFEKENRIGAYAGKMPDLNKPDRLDPRKETTYLNVIGAMLHILLNPPQDDKGNLKNINTQAAVIDEIVDLFGHKQGISERTLQDKFSAAKKSLDNS